MIDTSKTLTGKDGFTQVPNIVLRMYTLLDDFTIETSGMYAYLYSWQYNKPGDPLEHCVWLNQESIMKQTGLKYYTFIKHINILERYFLINIGKSGIVPNKKIYKVNEPLTEGEFRVIYSEELARFSTEIKDYERRVRKDQVDFKIKRIGWKSAQVKLSQQKEPKVYTKEEIDNLF